MRTRTYNGISLYGNIQDATALIVGDEMDEHIIDNWHHEEDREFFTWKEAVDYIIDNYKFHGEIQEIGID
tara:strand:+ start:70 stop:279 length:210 start_codon:yes stop_codon:yes gene_type:complete